jgi:hypothetical protein
MRITSEQEDELVKRTLRIPRSLYDAIQARADTRGISVNLEIVERLEAAAVSDQFKKLSAEVAEIKKLVRELLDKA